MEKILDLGCGPFRKYPGAIGVDFNNDCKPDIVHDLNKFPYPFKDNDFDQIYIDNTLEHLDKPMLVMNEVHRILKKDKICKVIVPYFRSRWAFIDPTHMSFFTVSSFEYFDPDSYIFKDFKYTRCAFKLKKRIFNEYDKRFFVKLLSKFASKHPWFYETFLSHLLPLGEITFYLKKV
tara:strand:- start:355 stop:885 length:531 start_codon:yes stop_codon:yes gene_type:complete